MHKSNEIIRKIENWIIDQEEVYGKLPSIDEGSPHSKVLDLNKEDHSNSIIMNAEEGKLNKAAQPKTESDINHSSELPQFEPIKTLDELRSLCEKTSDLRTDLEGTRLVFGVGNPNADLMLIGEAPGEQEDKLGEPFVGRAGQLLNKILEAIQFKRDDIYIANILKHRPPENRDPLPEERARSLPYLLKQIDIINPKLILCLGRVSAHTLLGNQDTMKSLRSIFHPFRGKYELMVTYHPAALLRNPNWKRDTWEDVKLLRNRYNELGCKP